MSSHKLHCKIVRGWRDGSQVGTDKNGIWLDTCNFFPRKYSLINLLIWHSFYERCLSQFFFFNFGLFVSEVQTKIQIIYYTMTECSRSINIYKKHNTLVIELSLKSVRWLLWLKTLVSPQNGINYNGVHHLNGLHCSNSLTTSPDRGILITGETRLDND